VLAVAAADLSGAHRQALSAAAVTAPFIEVCEAAI
jgi:hypothetical protein